MDILFIIMFVWALWFYALYEEYKKAFRPYKELLKRQKAESLLGTKNSNGVVANKSSRKQVIITKGKAVVGNDSGKKRK